VTLTHAGPGLIEQADYARKVGDRTGDGREGPLWSLLSRTGARNWGKNSGTKRWLRVLRLAQRVPSCRPIAKVGSAAKAS
jgi:hypothetical protein